MTKTRALVASIAVLAGGVAGSIGCGVDVTGSEPGLPDAGTTDAGTTDAPNTDAADAADAADARPVAMFTVGGTVTGLEGDGLVLENNGDTVALSKSNESFVFPKTVAEASTFNVTAKAQPTGPSQTCVITGGSGVASADVTDVKVACTTNRYPITVTVTGLVGAGLVLTNNAGDDLTVTPAGGPVTATFSTEVLSGEPFDVAVKTQPSGPPQECVVSGGTGTVVAGPVSTVTINCSNLYTVGGTVTGLTGSGLVLQNNAGDDSAVNANETFAFSTLATEGTDYAVTVKSNPTAPWQTCVVGNATGKVPAANVSSVTVTCTTDKHTVGGSISGLEGDGLVLQLNDGQTLTPASGDTSFVFDARDSGTSYTVSVSTQPTGPWQTCSVTTDASGVVAGADITTVRVECETNEYKTRVEVTGLSGTGLVLQNNGDDDLVVDTAGTYDFATSVTSGAPYLVSIRTQPTPSGEECLVSSGSGTVGERDVTVLVSCVRYKTVFVTSTRYDGNLGGLAGADAKCQDRAVAGGLSGTFMAWLSDPTGSPSTRFQPSTDSYRLVDGTVIADDYTSLTSAPLKHPIDKTELGGQAPIEPIFGRAVVWTDTAENGTFVWDGYHCQNWTSAAPGDAAIVGETADVTSWSRAYTGNHCQRPTALYCFEQ